METPDKLRLGFIGGCLTHQPGIPYARLFHRLLSKRLEDRRGIRLEAVVCDRYADEPSERLQSLLREGPLDAVLLHRSSNTFFTKTALVFVVQDPRQIRYVVHPMVLGRGSGSWLEHERSGFRRCVTLWKNGSPPGAADPPPARELPPKELADMLRAGESRPFRLNDLSWIAADRLGLVRWAIHDEARIVGEVHAVARRAGLPLLVLGPGLRIGHVWVNRFTARLDSALAAAVAPLESARYASLLTADPDRPSDVRLGVEHYMDQIHFNAAGHSLVADRLEPLLDNMLENIVDKIVESRLIASRQPSTR